MGGSFYIGGMGKESGAYCVSDFGAHNVDLGVGKLCAAGDDDPFCLVLSACLFGCFTIRVNGHVPILLSYGMLVNFNVVCFVQWYYTLL
jgi:hypothetical protein